MPSTSLARPIASLRFAHQMTASLAKDFTDEQACHQPSATDNHLVWSLGHLAATYAWMLSTMNHKGGVPESFNTHFGWGSKPAVKGKDCPALSEVRAQFESEFERFVTTIEGMSEAQLAQPLTGTTFAKDALEMVDRAAWHEGWHAGQIASLRRHLAMPGVMG